MSEEKIVAVRLGHIQVCSLKAKLHCSGIGSGVAVCLFDPISHVGGVAHVMLPRRPAHRQEGNPGLFADSALPALIAAMEEQGAERSSLVATVVGGAEMLSPNGSPAGFDIGAQNADAMLEALQTFELTSQQTEVGGSQCRSLEFSLDTGKVQVNVFAIPVSTALEAVAA
jgi:chemotaxis protein CheD